MSLKSVLTGLIMTTSLWVAGCDAIVYNTPSEVSVERAEVYQDNVMLEIDTTHLSPAALNDVADDYRRRAESPMLVTVSFDPASKTNTARKAADTAAAFADTFRHHGVGHIQPGTQPVPGSGEQSMTVIAYEAVSARKPSGCHDTMDMSMTKDLERMENYQLGCSVEDYLARQVARPGDLLGKNNMDNGQGRYNANSLEQYMSGEPSKELSGENASD